MTGVTAAIARLRKAAAQVEGLPSPYPLKRPFFGAPCCRAEIEELLGERLGGLSEYVEYLSLCRRVDAADVFCGYFLHSPLQIVRHRDSQPRVLHLDEGPGNQIEVPVMPVGSDGGGNLFLMGTVPPKAGAVWKWNHESGVRSDGMAKEGLTPIATTFSAFLERLATDWEHFVQLDREWPYVAG